MTRYFDSAGYELIGPGGPPIAAVMMEEEMRRRQLAWEEAERAADFLLLLS